MTLHDLKTGQSAVIKDIPDVDVATQAMRMGICVGEAVTVVAKVPGGPTVVQRGGMELAIGAALCRNIEVDLL